MKSDQPCYTPTTQRARLTTVINSFFFKRHLDDDEVLLATVHAHWIVGVKALIVPTACLAALWAMLSLLPDRLMLYVVLVLTVPAAVWWTRTFLDYFLDAWLITSKGVIDLDWHGWFHRSSSRVLYSDIQTVSYEVKGVPATLLGCGHVSIEKISTGTTIGIEFVKRPKRVERLILESVEAYMHKKNLKDAKVVQGILAEFVAGTLQKKEFTGKAKAT